METNNGSSSAQKIGSTQMGQDRTGPQVTATGRQQGRTG
jgi:hypothetical protein